MCSLLNLADSPYAAAAHAGNMVSDARQGCAQLCQRQHSWRWTIFLAGVPLEPSRVHVLLVKFVCPFIGHTSLPLKKL